MARGYSRAGVGRVRGAGPVRKSNRRTTTGRTAARSTAARRAGIQRVGRVTPPRGRAGRMHPMRGQNPGGGAGRRFRPQRGTITPAVRRAGGVRHVSRGNVNSGTNFVTNANSPIRKAGPRNNPTNANGGRSW